MYSGFGIVSSICTEREQGLTQGMTMIGLRKSTWHLSWFIWALVRYMITAVPLFLIIALTRIGSASNAAVPFFIVFLGVPAAIGTCGVFATVVRDPKAAVGILLIVPMLLSAPYFVILFSTLPGAVTIVLALLLWPFGV